jgi:hypothetical protein
MRLFWSNLGRPFQYK